MKRMRKVVTISLLADFLALLGLAITGKIAIPFFYSRPEIHAATQLTNVIIMAVILILVCGFLFVRFGHKQKMQWISAWAVVWSTCFGPLLVSTVLLVEAIKRTDSPVALFYRSQCTGFLLLGLLLVARCVFLLRESDKC